MARQSLNDSTCSLFALSSWKENKIADKNRWNLANLTLGISGELPASDGASIFGLHTDFVSLGLECLRSGSRDFEYSINLAKFA